MNDVVHQKASGCRLPVQPTGLLPLTTPSTPSEVMPNE